jgi:cell division inhibitor SulA
MANAAGWMSEPPNVWSRAWIRVAGLSLTGIFFVQLANMTFRHAR